jgi:hypothetical protein
MVSYGTVVIVIDPTNEVPTAHNVCLLLSRPVLNFRQQKPNLHGSAFCASEILFKEEQ